MTSAGRWKVKHAFWPDLPLNAEIKEWCVGGACTEAFHAEIICSDLCNPKAADPACHFEGERCTSS